MTKKSDELLAAQVARFKFLAPREWFTFWTVNADDSIDSTVHVYRKNWEEAHLVALNVLRVSPYQLHFEGEDE